MKVLFVATMYTHLANFHQPFIRLLQSQGVEVHCAASNAEGRREEIEALGVHCWEIPFNRRLNSLDNLRAYRQLKSVIAQNQYSFVHVHTPVASFIGRFLASRRGQKTIYTAHGLHFYKGAPWLNWLVYFPAEWLAAHWTDVLIVMNREDWDAGIKLGFIPEKSLFFVHGVGVNFNDYLPNGPVSSWRSEHGISAKDSMITCVADLTPRKNQLFLIRAWQKIAADHPEYRLIFVGEGRSRKTLEKYIVDQQIPGIKFLGFCRNIPEIMRDSQIVALVSRQEGLPKCLMEAMACARPVIATDIRGNRDLVDDKITGSLVPLDDVCQLAAALEKMLADPEGRQAMGLAGREKIQAYALENVLMEMAKIYDRFLNNNLPQ